MSQSDAQIEAIKTFSEGLAKTNQRIAVFNAPGALVRRPIRPEETQALGFDRQDDDFVLLQGDIVSTESAFYLGERVTGSPKYVVLNSSCDLAPGRRQCAVLLRVKEVRKSEPDFGPKLNWLLRFKGSHSMYLPVLTVDNDDVLCNGVEFDGICQIRSSDLLLAKRIASLSLVGWRIFAAFSQMVMARANPREIAMRSAVEKQPEQQSLDLSAGLGEAEGNPCQDSQQ
ncbi:MAG: hypothetical protein ACLQPN_15525 [Bryobacteraceae bacterium]